LAHTLGIKVVAEGVESLEIHDMLIAMDCDYVQGFYISRPIEQDQILNWCDQQQVQTAS
jgi:EAL domain-containing protein (putative c-di-GMP-specific phosphodiesterase class I)